MQKTKNKIIKLLILGLILGPNFLRFADTAKGQLDAYGYDPNIEINKLNNEIKSKKDNVQKIQDKQAAYQKAIEAARGQAESLNGELAILDNQLAKAQLDLESTQTEIDRTNLEIRKTTVEIDDTTTRIAKEKDQIATALRLIYQQDQTTTLEMLILHNSLSEFLSQEKYLEDINKSVGESLEAVKTYQANLEKEKVDLDTKNKELAKLKATLVDQQNQLEDQKSGKFTLLEETNMSEIRYQKLLAETKREQLQAANDIASAERKLREKMSQMQNNQLSENENGFIWPVPKNTITAYFHDPSYPFRNIFEHPAVDIRAAQGSPIRAAASGYVGRAHNGGMAYSYIMLIHADGMSTVYGHVSKIYVQEEEYVIQGQVIGLSGGLPGTPGAGPLTTGSHLHFETRLNGIPVNPLDYLP